MKKTTYGAKLDTSKIKCLCRDQRTRGYISYTMHQAADSCKYYFLLFSLGFVTLSAFTSLKTQQGWLAACFRKDHPASVSMANDKSRKWYIPWTEFCKYTLSYAYLWNLMKCSVRALPHILLSPTTCFCHVIEERLRHLLWQTRGNWKSQSES